MCLLLHIIVCLYNMHPGEGQINAMMNENYKINFGAAKQDSV